MAATLLDFLDSLRLRAVRDTKGAVTAALPTAAKSVVRRLEKRRLE
jgi:hypothetical protein